MDSEVGPAGGQEQEPAFAEALHSLLVSVHHMCNYHGVNRSAAALCAGLPDGLALTPATALQALRGAGLAAKLIECRLDSFSALVLPVILLRLDRRACLLMAIDDSAAAAPAYVMMLPEIGQGAVAVNASALQADYAGFAILVNPLAAGEQSAVIGAAVARRHWLSRILWRCRSVRSEALMLAALLHRLAGCRWAQWRVSALHLRQVMAIGLPRPAPENRRRR